MKILSTVHDKVEAVFNFPHSLLLHFLPFSHLPPFSSFILLCTFKKSSAHTEQQEEEKERRRK